MGFNSINIRHAFEHDKLLFLGKIVSSVVIIWKLLMCITGSESPVVFDLSESMDPAFRRGDILFLRMGKDPIRPEKLLCSTLMFLPYVGYVTIIMTENPIIKYVLIGALGLLAITSKS